MRLHALVSGRVQAVGFRFNTRRKAESLKLTGWAMNTPDGKVEVIAEGSKDVIMLFLKWLHQGPRFAHVDKVDYELTEISEKPSKYSSFTIKF